MCSLNVIAEKILDEKKGIKEKENVTKIVDGYDGPFCSPTDKKCIVHGYKYNGIVPNEMEKAEFEKIVKVLNKFGKKGSIDIVGHTDSTGSKKYNLKLSLARAKEAVKLLREYGLNERFTFGKITGKGEDDPYDTNDTAQGRYWNRRVEIFLGNVEFGNGL